MGQQLGTHHDAVWLLLRHADEKRERAQDAYLSAKRAFEAARVLDHEASAHALMVTSALSALLAGKARFVESRGKVRIESIRDEDDKAQAWDGLVVPDWAIQRSRALATAQVMVTGEIDE